MSRALLVAAETPREFRADPRFGEADPASPVLDAPLPVPGEAHDPLAEAFERGLAEGEARAHAACEAALAESEARCGALFGSLEGAIAVETDELRERLRQTVLALCEAAVLPLAIEPAGLARRCEIAAGMLSRAQDLRVIRLHPLDAELAAPHLSPEFRIEPDPALARGDLRIDTADGGLEDGPTTWRRALYEAFGEC